MIVSDECWLKDSCKKYKIMGKCDLFCPKLFKLDYLYNEALISMKQRRHINLRIDEDGTDRDIFLQLKELSSNIEDFVAKGKNLYMHSKHPGTGKTSWSLRFVQNYFDAIWYKSELTCKALYINIPRYLIELKDSLGKILPEDCYINHIKNNILKADIVIWDEIGTKVATEFEQEQLLSMINNRMDLGKSNIYTSNLSGEELQQKLGDRLYSRIINSSYDCELLGKDKRGIC